MAIFLDSHISGSSTASGSFGHIEIQSEVDGKKSVSSIIDFTSELLIPILVFQVHMLELLVIPF